jgi:hypothetical protein
MTHSEIFTHEIMDSLISNFELDKDAINQLTPVIRNVVDKNIKNLDTPNTKKIKMTTKKSTKDTKIPHKTAYHFFVAAKMGEVKNAGVAAKERMKYIGEIWKKLSDVEKEPFQGQAKSYNDFIDKELETGDWSSRRDAIMGSANQCAGIAPKPSKKSTSPKVSDNVPEKNDVKEETNDEVEIKDEVEISEKVKDSAPSNKPTVVPRGRSKQINK